MKNKFLVGFIVLTLILGGIVLGGKTLPKGGSAVADNIDMNHTISVSGDGIMTATPDIAKVNFGINVQKKSASDAMNSLSEKASNVLNTLKNAGVKEEDIKTTSINLRPVYEWNKESRKNVLVGYEASEDFMINSSIKEVGKFVSLAVNAGANKIYGISFDVADRSDLQNKAISKAMENARAKAEASLNGTNYKITGIKTISVQAGGYYPIYRDIAGKPTEGNTSVPVEGGSLTIKATVQVIFTFD